jgi:hypothetical protein
MNRYYEELASYDREGFFVIVDRTWDDVAISDCFDDTCYDIKDMERKVNDGLLDWFMLRVRVLVDGHELGSAYLGGCMYEDAREVLTDGTAEDLIAEALIEARSEVRRLKEKLNALEVQ